MADKKAIEKQTLKDLIKLMRKKMAADGDTPVAEASEEKEVEEPKSAPKAEVEADDDAEETKASLKRMFNGPEKKPKGVVISIVKQSTSVAPVKGAKVTPFKKKK